MFITRFLLVFETALIIGLLNFFLEKKIHALEINTYLKIAIIMLLAGGIFSLAYVFVEKIIRNTLNIVFKVQIIPFLNYLIHAGIIAVLYYLYSLYFFKMKVVTI